MAAGFDVELVLNDDRALFLDSVRSEEKKEVLRLVQEDMQKEIAETDIRVSYRGSGRRTDRTGGIRGNPRGAHQLYRIYHEKFPHWVVVAGSDERFFYVHDPLVETAKHTSDTDRVNMPILKKDFERMARYGKAQLKAMVVLRSRQAGRSTLNVVPPDYRRQIFLLQIRPNRPRSLTTKDYIARPELVRTRNPKIVNLSRAYSYLGAGYYCPAGGSALPQGDPFGQDDPGSQPEEHLPLRPGRSWKSC